MRLNLTNAGILRGFRRGRGEGFHLVVFASGQHSHHGPLRYNRHVVAGSGRSLLEKSWSTLTAAAWMQCIQRRWARNG